VEELFTAEHAEDAEREMCWARMRLGIRAPICCERAERLQNNERLFLCVLRVLCGVNVFCFGFISVCSVVVFVFCFEELVAEATSPLWG
jgi:hypothetical protein